METVIRIASVYVVVLVGFRIMGKRELGQLAPSELVTLLLIPEIFAQSIIGEDFSMVTALTAVSTLLALVYITSLAAHASPRFRDVVEAKPAVLVAHGKLVEANLDRERVTPDEVFTEMHMAGVEVLSQVKWAILEPDGKIAIVRCDDERPVQAPEKTAP